MEILGLQIRRKAAKLLAPVDDHGAGRGGWLSRIFEPFSGAWQRNIEWTHDSVLAFHAVFACITLIASDISKLRFKLVQANGPVDAIWSEVVNPAYSPVLRKPNDYQNHIQFKEAWINSKLVRGNTYVLKERDQRGVVNRLHVLDPNRVAVLVATDGSVFYQLQRDDLAELSVDGGVTVPASEIIHDRFNCLFHPLVGLSPIYASGLAACQGQKMQEQSVRFFGNGARPSGILTAPTGISDKSAAELKTYWDENFTGKNAGKIAVLAGDLKYQALTTSAAESQLIDQLKWTADVVCSTFHVPSYKINMGVAPVGQNLETTERAYYNQCLQVLIESMEQCLDEGLGLDNATGIELDLDGLLRMDTASLVTTTAAAVQGRLLTPNEGRRRLNYGPTPGGDSVLAQQQDYSLAAIAERDRRSIEEPATALPTLPAVTETPLPPDDSETKMAEWYAKAFSALETELEQAA